jgi:hypothetical protein
MSNISTINGVAFANISKVDNIAVANIAKITNVEKPSAGVSFTTDKLYLWYDGELESVGATSFTNKVDTGSGGALEGVTDVLMQSGHDSIAGGNASIVSVDSTQAMYLDGVNDSFYKRAYLTPYAGSGGNHGTSTFGVVDDSMVDDPPGFIGALEETGLTVKCWWRTSGSFLNNGNLWSQYSNNGIRTRFSSGGVRWFYMQSAGVMSSGWGTWNTDVWYHDVTTLSAPGEDGSTSGNHTLKLYRNGSLIQGLTSKNFNPSSYVRDFMLFGGSRLSGTSVQEDFRGFYGLVRLYHKPLSSDEVTTNYNAEKTRYGY